MKLNRLNHNMPDQRIKQQIAIFTSGALLSLSLFTGCTTTKSSANQSSNASTSANKMMARRVSYPLYLNSGELAAVMTSETMSKMNASMFELTDAVVNILDKEGKVAFRIVVPKGTLEHVREQTAK